MIRSRDVYRYIKWINLQQTLTAIIVDEKKRVKINAIRHESQNNGVYNAYRDIEVLSLSIYLILNIEIFIVWNLRTNF